MHTTLRAFTRLGLLVALGIGSALLWLALSTILAASHAHADDRSDDGLLGGVTDVVKDAATPVLNAVVTPVADEVFKPVTDKVVKPVTDKVVKPVTDKVVKPVVDTVVKPVADAVVAPVTNVVVPPVIDAVRPVTELIEPVIAPVVDAVAPSTETTVPGDDGAPSVLPSPSPADSHTPGEVPAVADGSPVTATGVAASTSGVLAAEAAAQATSRAFATVVAAGADRAADVEPLGSTPSDSAPGSPLAAPSGSGSLSSASSGGAAGLVALLPLGLPFVHRAWARRGRPSDEHGLPAPFFDTDVSPD